MSRGRVKTILLVLLVACCFLFAAQNWFGEGLWPQGQTPFSDTGFFSFFGEFFNRDGDQPTLSAYSALSDPEWIVVNRQGSQKEQYFSADAPYAELNALGDELLSALFAEMNDMVAAPIEGGAESYRGMLRTQSLCFRYRTPMPVDLLGRVLSLPNASLEGVQVVQELLFLPAENSATTCTLAVVDAKTEAAMTFRFPFDPERLRAAISRNTQEDSYLTYAFEINLGQEDTAVPLAPMTAISLDTVELPVLSASSVTAPLTETVLPLFGYNPNTPKRYTEADDSQVFLDRKSSLRIASDGGVEYHSDNETNGLRLGDSTESYALLKELLNLAERIDRAAFTENGAQLYITSDLTDLSVVTMDYVYGGRLVLPEEGHAVVAKLSAGQLIEYRQTLRNYQKTAETSAASDVLSAIDTLLENTPAQSVTTPMDLRLLYRDRRGAETVTAGWEVQ